MNIFNRIAMIVILLVVLLCLALGAVDVLFNVTSFQQAVSYLIRLTDRVSPLVLSLVFFVAFLVVACLLVLEFWTRRPGVAKIATLKAGVAGLTLESIAEQVEKQALHVRDVSNARARARLTKKGLSVKLLLGLAQGIDVPEKVSEVHDAVQNMLSERLGISSASLDIIVTEISGAPEPTLRPAVEKETSTEDKAKPAGLNTGQVSNQL